MSRPSRLTSAWRGPALLLLAATFAAADDAKPAPAVEIKHGDHIALVGNTLADRMQHHGWLEAHLYSRFPKHDLVVRDLGFSGDELTLRLRSQDFGTPDHWLGFTKADVIFAFFGYNESFAGAKGLDKFKGDLAAFIKHTLGQTYNGKDAPRLVLFSPIAHEDLHDRDLPDGKENNERLALYTAAMADVAKTQGVPFIDLFHATKDAYPGAPQPLTINGIHLTEAGDYTLAKIIDTALFDKADHIQRSIAGMEKIRQAVLEKDHYWFNRYRTVDGYSIYGGRADLAFVGGQTNRVVAQREMEVLDVMTANRDKRIWAVAQGGDLKVDDDNTPPFIPVVTNKPGNGPNGEHIFLSGEEAIGKMTVAKGMKVNLFASEKEFPELAKPVQMSFDSRGRLWVAAWPTYPHWKPKEEMNDKLLIFEDTDHDGKADKVKVFADGLHCPTGFEFANGGVLIAQAPDLMFLKDTDGDDKADVREPASSAAWTRPTPTTRPTASSSTRAAPSTSRRGRSTTPRSRPPTARRSGTPMPPSTATSRSRRSSRRTSPTASPTPTATPSTAGARTSSSTAPAPTPTTGPSSPATSTFPTSTAARPRSTSSGRAPARGPSTSPAPTSPRRTRGTCWSATSSASRASCNTRSRGRTPPSPAPRPSRCSRPPTRTSARRTSRSAPTARSTSSTGRTRSSATCSTTSATPAATGPTAGSTA